MRFSALRCGMAVIASAVVVGMGATPSRSDCLLVPGTCVDMQAALGFEAACGVFFGEIADPTGPIQACWRPPVCFTENLIFCPGQFNIQSIDVCAVATLGSSYQGLLTGATHPDCLGGELASASVGSTVLVFIDDVVISGPPGPVTVSVNWQIEVALSVSTIDLGCPPPKFSGAETGFAFGMNCLCNLVIANVDWNGGEDFVVSFTLPPAIEFQFDETSFVIPNQVFTTAEETWTANFPGVLFSRSDAGGTVQLGRCGTANTLLNVSVSLPYAGQVPVFNLPPGYTANSKSASIVDNVWMFDDCNANGTPDSIDIGRGDSPDVNGNAIPDQCECLADVSGDGVVNVLDLIDLLLCFGLPAVPECVAEDINGDGTVNVLDLIDLLLVFGTACP